MQESNSSPNAEAAGAAVLSMGRNPAIGSGKVDHLRSRDPVRSVLPSRELAPRRHRVDSDGFAGAGTDGLRNALTTDVNWNQIEGKWRQLTGSARERWGKPNAKRLGRVGRKIVFQTSTRIIKWASIPALLAASMFLFLAKRYEPLLAGLVILGAVFFIVRAVRSKEYCWAVGLVAIAAVFSPLVLAVKVFLLMGLTCITIFTTLLAVFRAQPAPAG
jgi:hypothetical protein